MSSSIPSFEGEKSYLLQRYALNGAQYAAIAATPLYALAALRRGHFSVRSLVRYNWGVPVAGGAAGVAAGYARTSSESAPSIASRTVEMRMDKAQVNRDDYFLVGSVIGGLLVPALFLRRAGLINGLLGGAGLGGAAGLLTSYTQQDGGIEKALSREGHRALETGRNMAGLAKEKGREASRGGDDVEQRLEREGNRAWDTGKNVANFAKEKGAALAEQAGQKAADARERGREIVERSKEGK